MPGVRRDADLATIVVHRAGAHLGDGGGQGGGDDGHEEGQGGEEDVPAGAGAAGGGGEDGQQRDDGGQAAQPGGDAVDDEGGALDDVHGAEAVLHLGGPVEVRGGVEPGVAAGVEVPLEGGAGVELEVGGAGAAVGDVLLDGGGGDGGVGDGGRGVVPLAVGHEVGGVEVVDAELADDGVEEGPRVVPDGRGQGVDYVGELGVAADVAAVEEVRADLGCVYLGRMDVSAGVWGGGVANPSRLTVMRG